MIRAQLLTNHQGSAVVSARNAEGRVHVRILPMAYEAYLMGVEATKRGAFIQDAFRALSDTDREFLKSGMTPVNWYDLFKGSADAEEQRGMRDEALLTGPQFLTPDQFELIYSGEKFVDEIYAYNRKQIESRFEVAPAEELTV